MNPGKAVFLPAIICVAGLSFAAGRLVTNARAPGDSPPARALPEGSAPELVGVVSAPEQIPDIIALPFVETYRILKFATPETIRSYYKQLAQLPLGPKRNAPLTAFFKTLIQANPSLTKDLILELKKDDRWLPMGAIRDAAPPRGMETVAEVLLSFDRIEISGCSYDVLRDNLDEWGKSDPLALKKFLETHRAQDVERYFDKLVLNWAAYDPEAARQWMTEEIQKRPPSPQPPEGESESSEDASWRGDVEEMEVAWVEGFLANDPDAAVNYVLEHTDNAAIQRAMFWFGGNLFAMSPDRARDFILQLPEEYQGRSLDSIANKANVLVRSDASDNTTSPRYVADWMLQFPPKAWQDGIGHVLGPWEMANPQELFAWMTDLPPQTREAVVQGFPSYVSAADAQEDFDRMMLAGDPVLRDQLLERLMSGAQYARAAMLAVLEKAQLSTAQRSRLASLIPLPVVEETPAPEAIKD